jgi:hypothetical protein
MGHDSLVAISLLNVWFAALSYGAAFSSQVFHTAALLFVIWPHGGTARSYRKKGLWRVIEFFRITAICSRRSFFSNMSAKDE